MIFDCFFSICQVVVDGTVPSEKVMFQNFFDQVRAADELGYGTAWIAESHLSCEVQKRLPGAVIPNFQGEIGLNTDVLLMASKVFQKTRRIHVGSAIRSLLVNGGPMAHAEAVRSFLALHGLDADETRQLHLGFAAGRFPFSSQPYGIAPRDAFEAQAWPVVKGKIFLEATEIFLRFLRGDVFSSEEVGPVCVSESDFRTSQEWEMALATAKEGRYEVQRTEETTRICLRNRWPFQKSGIIPKDYPRHLLKLLIGSHDPHAQALANQFLPCGVFNLSITPGDEIERTHQRMAKSYFNQEDTWGRNLMPRTVLVFLNADKKLSRDQQSQRAQQQSQSALKAYWNALEGTLDPARIQKATNNALIGNPEEIVSQLKERFHPEDRLMLWFDFFNHDSAQIIESMHSFAELVAPHFSQTKSVTTPHPIHSKAWEIPLHDASRTL